LIRLVSRVDRRLSLSGTTDRGDRVRGAPSYRAFNRCVARATKQNRQHRIVRVSSSPVARGYRRRVESQCENLDREFGAKKRTRDIFLLVGVGVRAIVAARDAMPISAIRRLFSSMRAARAASNAFVSVVMRAFESSFVVE